MKTKSFISLIIAPVIVAMQGVTAASSVTSCEAIAANFNNTQTCRCRSAEGVCVICPP